MWWRECLAAVVRDGDVDQVVRREGVVLEVDGGQVGVPAAAAGVLRVDVDPGPVAGAGIDVGGPGDLRPGVAAVEAPVEAGVEDRRVAADLRVVERTGRVDRVVGVAERVRVGAADVREADTVRRAREGARTLPRHVADPDVDSATAGSLPSLEPGIVVGPVNPGPEAPAAGNVTSSAPARRNARGNPGRTDPSVPRSSAAETASYCSTW
jgi:hypothetical protein